MSAADSVKQCVSDACTGVLCKADAGTAKQCLSGVRAVGCGAQQAMGVWCKLMSAQPNSA